MKKHDDDKYKQTPETLRMSILAMQEKLIAERDEFVSAPLSIEVRMNDGRYVDRANPFTQEYRALVRDYSAALKTYKELTNAQDDAEIDQLGDLRSRFKVMG